MTSPSVTMLTQNIYELESRGLSNSQNDTKPSYNSKASSLAHGRCIFDIRHSFIIEYAARFHMDATLVFRHKRTAR